MLAEYSNIEYLKLIDKRRAERKALTKEDYDGMTKKINEINAAAYSNASEEKKKIMRATDRSRKLTEF